MNWLDAILFCERLGCRLCVNLGDRLIVMNVAK